MKIIGKLLELSEDDVNSIIKVNKVFDLFFELNKLIKSMSEKEFKMLEKSLEITKKEMERNE